MPGKRRQAKHRIELDLELEPIHKSQGGVATQPVERRLAYDSSPCLNIRCDMGLKSLAPSKQPLKFLNLTFFFAGKVERATIQFH
uniref:Uncharacterized protein n=1 Tax=Oryza brachyantha TaxID=4533 RepID=J3MD58_ORYBR